ncbi:hypothetical protein JCGZ_06658 [Jatropha curcas]|uniref:Uncharacterized protein n=1 Tax=Jatropha curcas TaxID=180498 RepID=A0A067LCL2_JATCU|nr:hypothetical protein JCGZ_06658 [Jatropha curcas]
MESKPTKVEKTGRSSLPPRRGQIKVKIRDELLEAVKSLSIGGRTTEEDGGYGGKQANDHSSVTRSVEAKS